MLTRKLSAHRIPGKKRLCVARWAVPYFLMVIEWIVVGARYPAIRPVTGSLNEVTVSSDGQGDMGYLKMLQPSVAAIVFLDIL